VIGVLGVAVACLVEGAPKPEQEHNLWLLLMVGYHVMDKALIKEPVVLPLVQLIAKVLGLPGPVVVSPHKEGLSISQPLHNLEDKPVLFLMDKSRVKLVQLRTVTLSIVLEVLVLGLLVFVLQAPLPVLNPDYLLSASSPQTVVAPAFLMKHEPVFVCPLPENSPLSQKVHSQLLLLLEVLPVLLSWLFSLPWRLYLSRRKWVPRLTALRLITLTRK